MEFSECLNGYIALLGCNAKELSLAAGISAPAISRYRAGERVPIIGSDQLRKLARGIADLSGSLSEKRRLTETEVLDALTESISGIAGEYEAFLANLNKLLDVLGVTNSDIARTMSFDPSYVSRILSGKRHPADMQKFVAGVSRYLARCYAGTPQADLIARTVSCAPDLLRNENMCALTIARWLNSSAEYRRDSVSRLLEILDAFDLHEFAHAMGFHNVPPAEGSFDYPKARLYTGAEECKQAVLDFLRAASLSPDDGELFLYSDIPVAQLADDEPWMREWLDGCVRLLRRGLHLDVIHDTNHPVNELLLGVESWVPLYMTGKVSPHYLAEPQHSVFGHLLAMAPGVVLAGESVVGSPGEARFLLATGSDDMAYYRKRASSLLMHASPLMEVYRSDRKAEARRLMDNLLDHPGDWLLAWGSAPLFTIPDKLLADMLKRNGLPAADRHRIADYAKRSRAFAERLMAKCRITLEVPDITPGEMEQAPVSLALSGLYYEKDVAYTYEEYAAHLEATERYLAAYPSCTLKRNTSPAFRNINISVLRGKYVVISKRKSPTIHFFIEHPDIIPKFEKLIAPIGD